MASGTWTRQNKIRPGVYVNVNSEGQGYNLLGERGIAAYPAPLPWGESFITLEAATYSRFALAKLGFRANDPRIRHITSAMAHASKVMIYRLGTSGAAKATATLDSLTATAKYAGARGNDLTVSVQANIDDDTLFDVATYLDSEEVDMQTVTAIEGLVANDFVEFAGTGDLIETAGTQLSGGADGSITNGDYADAFAAFEAEQFNVIGIPTDDDAIKELAVNYVKRLRDEDGKKVQAVVCQYPQADYEGVISLKNSIITNDGLQVEPKYLLWEIAAMSAAANINESLTYKTIPNAADVYPKLTNGEIEDALLNGELVLTSLSDRVVIEQDINTLTTFTEEKGSEFSKNRVIRVLDSINNDFVRIFSDFFIGKVDNTDDGRNLLKGECINYMESLQNMAAIQNFIADDVIVQPGEQIDGVYMEVYVQPVDSIEKIYIDVVVTQGGAA